jgi:hypothetical protein
MEQRNRFSTDDRAAQSATYEVPDVQRYCQPIYSRVHKQVLVASASASVESARSMYGSFQSMSI